MDVNRLQKELREIQADTKSGVTVQVLGDDLSHMQGTILGESTKNNRHPRGGASHQLLWVEHA